ncbi:winged helix-turn-helix domain-containing protein [uncultured Thiohalocapsa sp.]|uniref:winged helix-turn-helix domain-containing protein n=1 Tax=uncultured Thiohalocapsa sp. TaxID=768990 RepID=UPI0025FF4D30|nr:winged helix-turn-helix domain-containing protein [uncultured Thiohalocapsa sp.]
MSPTQGDGQPSQADSGVSAAGSADCLRVGDWDAEPALNLLHRTGQEVHLEPRAMELLVFLARRPGQVVPRDDLLAALWQGVTVGDDALTQVAIKLRKALGDDSRAPRYIQTVRKRGYRLIAGVSPCRPEAGTRRSVARRPCACTPWRRGALASALLAVILLASLLLRPVATWPTASANVRAGTTAAADATATVVLMPFAVIGDHPGQRYLAQGLAAALTADLSRAPGLQAIRIQAASAAPPAGRARGGDAVFELFGAIQHLGDQMAVEVSLVERRTGRELWSERYYQPIGDVFAFRDQIQACVAARLSVRLAPGASAHAVQHCDDTQPAYHAFLKVKAALLPPAAHGKGTASERQREASRLDAEFGRTYRALALLHAADYRHRRVARRDIVLARAEAMARNAMRIDAASPESHWVLARVVTLARRHNEALGHLDRALAMAPDFTDALALKASIMTDLGRPRAALALLDELRRRKASTGPAYCRLLGRAQFFLGDFERAARNLREATDRDPTDLEAHVLLAATLSNMGDDAGADWETAEVRALAPEFSIRTWFETYPMQDAGQKQALADALRRLHL